MRLFQPITLRGLELENRIVVAPMTQFSADDGVAGDWHLMHLGKFAVGGAGLVLAESTYVTPEGRNSKACLSIYNEEQEHAVKRIADFFKQYGRAKFGVQLNHAGRKASAREPWDGGGPLHIADGGYETVAPSDVPLDNDWPAPRSLEICDIQDILSSYGKSAQRANRAGVDHIEIHGAHGYLIHQFLSPLTNQRSDAYGGSRKNRMRFLLEVFEVVRHAWPDEKPIGVRFSATDWVPGGWDVADMVKAAKFLEELGIDYVHVSSGGLSREQQIIVGPAYQTRFAAAVKTATNLPIIAVGQIYTALQAETIIATGQADMVALGRGMLYNPNWPYQAARELGVETQYPRQYVRGNPKRWGGAGLNGPGNLDTG